MKATGAFEPLIPQDLITDSFRDLAEALGVQIMPSEHDESMVYLVNVGFCTFGWLNDREVSEEHLYEALQEMIRRSEGRLTWVSHEQAYTGKLKRGQFGGSAAFITADRIHFHSTSDWLSDLVGAAEKGIFRRATTEIEAIVAAGDADNDYLLQGDSAWLEVGDYTVYIRKDNNLPAVEIFETGKEDEEPLAAADIFDMGVTPSEAVLASLD